MQQIVDEDTTQGKLKEKELDFNFLGGAEKSTEFQR